MSFRQGGHSDERRRRVLIDDRAQTSGTESAEAARLRKGKSLRPGGYTAAAREENQPRITDLLPTRQRYHSLGLAAGFACVVGLEALYGYSWDWARTFGTATTMPLDPNRCGALAGWFASTLLGLIALLSVLVYHLRRFKEDDYHGRYRIWLWTAGLALLASLDATSGIHHSFAQAMYRATGMGLSSHGVLWPYVVFGPIYFFVGLRLLIEVWESPGAVAALTAAGTGYSLALANSFGAFGLHDAMLQTMVTSTGALLGHLAVAYMSAQYARHVFLDAQGRLALKAKRKQKAAAKTSAKETAATEAKAASTGTAATTRRSDLETPATSKTASTKPATSSVPARSQAADDDDDEQTTSGQNSLQRHLSKAERKRLARQQQFQGSQRKAA